MKYEQFLRIPSIFKEKKPDEESVDRIKIGSKNVGVITARTFFIGIL